MMDVKELVERARRYTAPGAVVTVSVETTATLCGLIAMLTSELEALAAAREQVAFKDRTNKALQDQITGDAKARQEGMEEAARIVEQVADPNDESKVGECAADAFNDLDGEDMSRRLEAWNRVIAAAIRKAKEQP